MQSKCSGYHSWHFSLIQPQPKILRIMISVCRLRQRKTWCTKVSAANTLNLQQVSDGVHGCVQVGANWADIRRCWSEDQWHILTVTCFWLKSCCLQWVRSVPYSLSSNNAMLLLLLTQRERHSTSWNDRYQSCFHFTTLLLPNSTDLNRLDRNRWGEMQQQVYQHRWTEAALDKCLA